ncbi:hypothetical protein ASG65_18330 [Bacillus sp. Leaf13]|nr:hypothetical protein ASG65_18330 [Bacillus sp. Leaf13]
MKTKFLVLLTSFIFLLFSATPSTKAASVSIQSQMLTLAENAYKDQKVKTKVGNKWVLYKNSNQKVSGFNAKIYKRTVSKGKYEYCIAFRGTKEKLDVVTDLTNVMDGIKGLQTKKAISITKDLIKKEKGNMKKLYFTGHSLGGFLASWVQSEVIDGDIKVPVSSKAYVFNAPGISTLNILAIPLMSTISKVPNPFLKIFNTKELTVKMSKDKLKKYDKSIYNYLIKYDPVSLTGDNLGTVVWKKSKKSYKNPFKYHSLVRFHEIKL